MKSRAKTPQYDLPDLQGKQRRRERKTGNFRNLYIRQDLQDLQDAVQEYLQLNRPLRSRREAR